MISHRPKEKEKYTPPSEESGDLGFFFFSFKWVISGELLFPVFGNSERA